jgi:hypothetical protein
MPMGHMIRPITTAGPVVARSMVEEHVVRCGDQIRAEGIAFLFSYRYRLSSTVSGVISFASLM